MTNIWRHSRGIDQEVAAIFDPFGNAVHTSLSFPVLGKDVLITGAGPTGLMTIPAVRHAGARHVVITDMNSFRLDLAQKMGATLAVNPSDILVQREDIGDMTLTGATLGATSHHLLHISNLYQ